MTNSGTSIIIKGIGSYVPEKRLTNDDLSRMVDTSDEWIFTRSGIRERRIAETDEHTSTMAIRAAEKAITASGVPKEEIDLLIVASLTPDMPFPATSCTVQHELGLNNITAFDVNAACSGFPYALEVATKMLASGAYKNALVIGSEKMSSILDWEDRSTCVLFGDGAGAVVLSHLNQANFGVIDSYLAADGSHANILCQKAGGCAEPLNEETMKNKDQFLKMNGREVFKFAVRHMEESIRDILARNNLKPDDINLVIPHQANVRIIKALTDRLDFPFEKCFINLDKYGNTSAASIPIALAEAHANGRIQKNDYILLVAFGAGLTWGATLVKWY